MKAFWKNLKSKLTEKHPAPASPVPKQTPRAVVGPRSTAAESSPEGCGKLAGDNIPGNSPAETPRPEGAPEPNSSLNTQNSKLESNPFIHESTNPFDSEEDNRNGKIARLPRPLRERINQALYQRFPAVRIVQELNQMPEVKAVLAEHFDGRPILPQNISEWKQGGYRDWLHRRQILDQKRELGDDAKDLANTAPEMADSLFSLLTLDYAHLMMNRDKEDPEQFEKKRKALSTLAQDIVRLRRCHLNARRVQIQETRLDNDTEKTGEQLLSKFTEWSQNPKIRKALILAPMERDRQLRILSDLPPAPEDPLVERETRDDPYFGRSNENQTEIKPNPAKNSTPESNAPAPRASENSPESTIDVNQPTASPSPGGEGWDEGELNLNTDSPPQPPAISPSPAPEETQEDMVGPRSTAAESSPEGRGKLAGDNIPGNSPAETPRPEGAPEPNSTGGDADLVWFHPANRMVSKSHLREYMSLLAHGKSPEEAKVEVFGWNKPVLNPPKPIYEPYALNPIPTSQYYGPCNPPATLSTYNNLGPRRWNTLA
jgi:hypothetical protein